MKRQKYAFENIRVASPCSANWSEMAGDERARFCSLCKQHVYNFSTMSGHEIAELIKQREGQKTCVRFYRRKDGTILTRDCPVGFRNQRRKTVGAFAAMASLVAGGFGWMMLNSSQETTRGRMMGQMVMGDMVAPEDIDIVDDGPVIMGEMMIPEEIDSDPVQDAKTGS